MPPSTFLYQVSATTLFRYREVVDSCGLLPWYLYNIFGYAGGTMVGFVIAHAMSPKPVQVLALGMFIVGITSSVVSSSDPPGYTAKSFLKKIYYKSFWYLTSYPNRMDPLHIAGFALKHIVLVSSLVAPIMPHWFNVLVPNLKKLGGHYPVMPGIRFLRANAEGTLDIDGMPHNAHGMTLKAQRFGSRRNLTHQRSERCSS
ncbi:Sodium:neurotransmitter symporter family protein [Colletotrichum cuscutae]|uniref:Sodium:neurotransmitter symporter family protein n=1 Tax=Colletotrichum cuscutae TaxID=1209917 RepID=A0AAI9Y2U0_9PEZI|nr:Sodium:neurotransmitter symporter family protein [Colletotrichum cuscutae]